jgi:hypothetical protein
MNGHGVENIQNLIKDRAYQRELLELLCSLTAEKIDGGETRLVAAIDDREAARRAIAFRRKHGLLVDPNADDLIYVIGLHQALIRHRALTRASAEGDMLARARINYSEHWLIRQGKGTDVDKLFNPKPEQTNG